MTSATQLRVKDNIVLQFGQEVNAAGSPDAGSRLKNAPQWAEVVVGATSCSPIRMAGRINRTLRRPTKPGDKLFRACTCIRCLAMVHSILFVAVALSIVSATNYVAAFTPRRGLSCTGRKPLSSQIQPISSVPPTFHSQKQFHELGFSSSIIETVKSLGIESPSKIQAIAAHGLSSGHHCIIADQTGSGKTLAYLLPTLQRMLLITRKNSQVKRVSPYMVVLAPTTELAM